MKYKQHLGMVFMALAAGFLGSWGHYQWFSSEKDLSSPPSLLIQQPISDGLAGNVSFLREYGTMEVPSFVEASNTATQAVVFIKTISEVRQSSPFWFFDNDPFGSIGQVSSTGSGVIMSSDGYIVTNLHVIKNAVKIEVVLNNRKKVFPAELVGQTPPLIWPC
jgi:serine protease Do